MDPELEGMLKRMGWTSGAHLPLANKENKALQNELEKFMTQKAKAAQVLEREEARFGSIQNHMKHVHEQSLENQKLLVLYQQHLEAQQNKFFITRSEKDRIAQDTRHCNKQLKDLETKFNSKSDDLNRGLTKMEKMKTESNWDAEALKAWEESLKKRDEDNELLKKFSQQDEHKAKELESKRQNLQMSLKSRTELLTKTVGEVVGYEQMLVRAGKTFKQLKDERQSQTKQWQEAVNNLRQRDNLIDQAVKEISMVQSFVQEQQELLDEQNNFLNIELGNNKEVEAQINESNIYGSKLRKELNDVVQYVLTLTGEVNALKRNVISAANCLEKERVNSRNVVIETMAQTKKYQNLENEIHKLEDKVNELKTTSTNAKQQTQYLEQMLEKEQRQAKNYDMEIERVQGFTHRTQQGMTELKNIAKAKETEISGCETAITTTKKYTQEVYNELKKQKEISYDMEFIINQLEGKLFKLEGAAANNEEKLLLEAKVMDLEKELASETELKVILQNQVSQIEDEMRRLHVAIESDNIQLEMLKSRLQSEVLSFEGGSKQVNAAKQIAQHKQVEENILRLRLNQLGNVVKKENSSIINLQKFKLELEVAMREREIEINSNKEILFVKRRNLDEEKGRLKRDLASRRIKIEQLQKRLHIAVMALGRDEDGQPMTITHFKVKNAQERYFLQTEGDQLDAKIKKAEKEIVAMENTLAVINGANNNFSKSLSAIGQEDHEMEEMKELEEELSRVKGTLRNRQREHANKKIQVKELQQKFDNAEEEKAKVTEELQTVKDELNDLQRHGEQLDERIKRTDRLICASVKNIKMTNIDKYKKNIFIRQLQEAHKRALEQLAEAASKYSEMSYNICRYMTDNGLQLPGLATPLSPSSSCRSSGSSRSSKYYQEPPHVANLSIVFNLEAESSTRRKKT